MNDGWIERKPTPSEELGRVDEAVRDLTQQLAAERKRREEAEASIDSEQSEREAAWDMYLNEKSARERAEADNAALLTAIQQARTNLLYCTSTTPESLRRDVLHCLDPAAKADHPGAAMLELARLVRNYQHKDEATLADTFQRLMNERSRIAKMVSPEIHTALLERMRALEEAAQSAMDLLGETSDNATRAWRVLNDALAQETK